MRNYQLRKTNDELTLKKKIFLANNKWGAGGWDCIYICIYAFALYVLVLLY